MSSRSKEMLHVAEQAAAWLVAIEEGDQAQHAGFADWLRESPLHVEMFLRAAAVERMVDAVPEETRAAINASLTQIDPKVAPLTPVKAPLTPSTRPRMRSTRTLATAASVLAAVGTLTWVIGGSARSERFTTAVGEQRSVSLSDGSLLYLNADTRVEVRYSGQSRSVRLMNGEALFKVQADPARPFRVQVDDAVVQALGTQFNVYRRDKQTTVAVIEGSVRVSAAAGAAAQILPAATRDEPPATGSEEVLTAGEAASISTDTGRVRREKPVDVQEVAAWRQRRLIFRWATLDEIVKEFNRYNRAPQIRIESRELLERRYTAVFDADAPQELLKFLERDGVTVALEGNEWVAR